MCETASKTSILLLVNYRVRFQMYTEDSQHNSYSQTVNVYRLINHTNSVYINLLQ